MSLHSLVYILTLFLSSYIVCVLSRVSYVSLSRSLSQNREPTVEKPFWPAFPIKFVKYTQYLPHLIEKPDSKWLSLVTISILGQAPSLGNYGFFTLLNRYQINEKNIDVFRGLYPSCYTVDVYSTD